MFEEMVESLSELARPAPAKLCEIAIDLFIKIRNLIKPLSVVQFHLNYLKQNFSGLPLGEVSLIQ